MKPRLSWRNWVEWIVEWPTRIVCYGWLVIMFVEVYEVMMRYVFHRPTTWAFDLTLFIYGPAFLLAGAYTLRHGAHASIDMFYARLSRRKRLALDCLFFLLLIIFSIHMTVYTGEVAWEAIKAKEVSLSPSHFPMYPARAAMPVAGFLLFLQSLTMLVDAVRGLFQSE